MSAVVEFFAAVATGAFAILFCIVVFLASLAAWDHKREAGHAILGVAICALVGYGILYLLDTYIGALL